MPDIRKPYASFSRYSADLCLFLLVAQRGQISLAADEAGISQPRMSQRMRALEEGLGHPLLVRGRRGVALTAAGQRLRDALADPMAAAIAGFDGFRSAPGRNEVVILSDIAFSSFRLLPEYHALSAAFEDLSISLLSRQIPRARAVHNADLVVRMEPSSEMRAGSVCLFRERVSAVCSRAYLNSHPDIRRPADLLDKTLIELAADGPAPWYTWDSWMRESGCPLAPSQEVIAFNSYDHVYRSAASGLGVALGWHGLIDLDSPETPLVRALPHALESDRGYVLSLVPSRTSAATTRVFEWLASRFAD